MTEQDDRSPGRWPEAGPDQARIAGLTHRSWRRVLPWAIPVVVLVAIIYIVTHRGSGPANLNQRPDGKTRPISVGVASVVTGDVDVNVEALGTVTPVATVTVHSRIDGQLMRLGFTEGQLVREGDTLVQLDPRPYEVQLEQARGQLIRDQALLGNAKVDLERYRLLYSQDSIAQQQVATQEGLVRQYEGAVITDQGQVDSAKLNLIYAKVTAPVSGRVGLRQVDLGNIVHAADTNGVAVITQLQPITVIFTVPEDRLPQITRRVAQPAPVPVDAYDRTFSTKLATGTLLTFDNQIDPTTGTVKLRAQFPNADFALFPQQFVNVRVKVDTERGATLIPSSAVLNGAQGQYVWSVQPDQTVKMVNITPSVVSGERTAVTSGVTAGTQVVVDGMDRLRDGSRITLVDRGQPAPAPAAPAQSAQRIKGKGKNGAQRPNTPPS
jgi:membrane fusion protein, multidrug efflux system